MINCEEVRHALTGPIMSLCTPFLSNGDIDYDGIRRILDYTIEEGRTKTVVLTNGDSLFTIMTDEEIAEEAKVVIEHTAGRAMVVASDDFWWTGKDIEFARHVRDLGADMLMVRPPDWAFSCTVDTIVEHYAAIAEQGIPLMLVTNFLKERPLPMSCELLKKLRNEVGGIYAVKDDICGEFGRRLGLLVYDRWALISSGSKRDVVNAMPYGCDGYMSNFILFYPDVAHNFWQAIRANDMVGIRKIIREYDVPCWDFITNFPGGCDAVIHGILELNGLCKRWRRKPYYSLSDKDMENLAVFLKGKNWL